MTTTTFVAIPNVVFKPTKVNNFSSDQIEKISLEVNTGAEKSQSSVKKKYTIKLKEKYPQKVRSCINRYFHIKNIEDMNIYNKPFQLKEMDRLELDYIFFTSAPSRKDKDNKIFNLYEDCGFCENYINFSLKALCYDFKGQTQFLNWLDGSINKVDFADKPYFSFQLHLRGHPLNGKKFIVRNPYYGVKPKSDDDFSNFTQDYKGFGRVLHIGKSFVLTGLNKFYVTQKHLDNLLLNPLYPPKGNVKKFYVRKKKRIKKWEIFDEHSGRMIGLAKEYLNLSGGRTTKRHLQAAKHLLQKYFKNDAGNFYLMMREKFTRSLFLNGKLNNFRPSLTFLFKDSTIENILLLPEYF